MAGISRAERERRHTEDVLAVMDRPFRDRPDVVCFVGSAQRAYCEPCKSRDWGAQIRLAGADVFRCIGCLRAMVYDLRVRINQMEDRPDATEGVQGGA